MRKEEIKMIIPKYKGRILQEAKRYNNFILFEDPKTKIKICYTYEQLDRKQDKPKKTER